MEYGALTEDGLLREAVFKGLRDDLAPGGEAFPPGPLPPPGQPKISVPKQNMLQLLPDAIVPSREELTNYWNRVWEKALPGTSSAQTGAARARHHVLSQGAAFEGYSGSRAPTPYPEARRRPRHAAVGRQS